MATLTGSYTVKDFGVFDSRVSFVPHITNLSISNFASKTLGFILQSSKILNNTSLIKTLYLTFVVNKFEYTSVIWSPHHIYLQL